VVGFQVFAGPKKKTRIIWPPAGRGAGNFPVYLPPGVSVERRARGHRARPTRRMGPFVFFHPPVHLLRIGAAGGGGHLRPVSGQVRFRGGRILSQAKPAGGGSVGNIYRAERALSVSGRQLKLPSRGGFSTPTRFRGIPAIQGAGFAGCRKIPWRKIFGYPGHPPTGLRFKKRPQTRRIISPTN